jgi:hypothetical protein
MTHSSVGWKIDWLTSLLDKLRNCWPSWLKQATRHTPAPELRVRESVPPLCPSLHGLVLCYVGTKAVSCRLPTVATCVRSQVKSCGICGGQIDTGAGFLRVLRFSLPLIPHSYHISSGLCNRANSGRRAKWKPQEIKYKLHRYQDTFTWHANWFWGPG